MSAEFVCICSSRGAGACLAQQEPWTDPEMGTAFSIGGRLAHLLEPVQHARSARRILMAHAPDGFYSLLEPFSARLVGSLEPTLQAVVR